jgi:hypothetical protein
VIETVDEKGYSLTAGLRVYNVADPEKPREIGFMPVDGFGLHRMWYGRRPASVRIGAHPRLRAARHRYVGSDQAARSRALLAAGDVGGERREAVVAERTTVLGASCDRSGREYHRIFVMARWRDGAA